MPRRTVLVVEDDVDSRDWLVEALSAEGYDVICAENGATGLRYALQAAPPDLILLDMMMPVVNGWDFLTALARIRPRPPVVVITASHKVHGVPAGAEAALKKPVNVMDLLETVRRYVAAAPPG